MPAAALELQKAVHAWLTGDAALVAALGGARVHDHVPAGAPFPYVLHGPATMRDWGAGGHEGAEITFTLHVWSKARGKSEVLAIMELVRVALDGTPPEPETGRLVLLRLERAEAELVDDLAACRGRMRFRALVESEG